MNLRITQAQNCLYLLYCTKLTFSFCGFLIVIHLPKAKPDGDNIYFAIVLIQSAFDSVLGDIPSY